RPRVGSCVRSEEGAALAADRDAVAVRGDGPVELAVVAEREGPAGGVLLGEGALEQAAALRLGDGSEEVRAAVAVGVVEAPGLLDPVGHVRGRGPPVTLHARLAV